MFANCDQAAPEGGGIGDYIVVRNQKTDGRASGASKNSSGRQRAPAELLRDLIGKNSGLFNKNSNKNEHRNKVLNGKASELECEVSKEEVNKFFGFQQNSHFVDSLFNVLATSEDGKLKMRELLYGLAVFSGKGNLEDKLKLLFELYDLDGSGRLTREKVSVMLRQSLAENNLTIADQNFQILLDGIFESMDITHQGYITFEDFKNYMTVHKRRELRYLNIGTEKLADEKMERRLSLMEKAAQAEKDKEKEKTESESALGANTSGFLNLPTIVVSQGAPIDLRVNVDVPESPKLEPVTPTGNFSPKNFGAVHNAGTGTTTSSSLANPDAFLCSKSYEPSTRVMGSPYLKSALKKHHSVVVENKGKTSRQPSTIELLESPQEAPADLRKQKSFIARITTRLNYKSRQALALERRSQAFPDIQIDEEETTWVKRLKTYMAFEGMKLVLIMLWMMANVGVAVAWWFKVSAAAQPISGYGVYFAKAFSAVINLNSALLLLPVCYRTLSMFHSFHFIADYFPLDKNIVFHKLFAIALVVASLGHAGAHGYNIFRFTQNSVEALAKLIKVPITPEQNTATFYLFQTIPGTTGIALLLVLFVMFAFSLFKKIRKRHFNAFYYTHFLFVAYYGLLIAHGMQMLLSSPISWAFVCFPVALYLLERVTRIFQGVKCHAVVQATIHASNVAHLEISKPFNYRAGQYIKVNCPKVSLTEWHPFTISSSPDQDTLSIDILGVGDWSNKVCKLYSQKSGRDVENKIYPSIRIDGPYSTCTEQTLNYKVVMMICAGIGATPYISILRHILHLSQKHKGKLDLTKIYFYWVNRNENNFQWFVDTLSELSSNDTYKFLKIQTYLSKATNKNDLRSFLLWNSLQEHYSKTKVDLVTGLKSRTYWGRPNFEQMFDFMIAKHPKEKVGVFFCGPQSMSKQLYRVCKNKSQLADSETFFEYHKENF